MRFSMVIASILLFPLGLLAQHSPGASSTPSSPSSVSNSFPNSLTPSNVSAPHNTGTGSAATGSNAPSSRSASAVHQGSQTPTAKGTALPAEAVRQHSDCPQGQSVDKNGGCIASIATNVSTQCPPNAPGVPCRNNADECVSVRGQLDEAAAELRSINGEMENAGCSGASGGQVCGSLVQRRDAAVARYRGLQNRTGAACPGALPDPLAQ